MNDMCVLATIMFKIHLQRLEIWTIKDTRAMEEIHLALLFTFTVRKSTFTNEYSGGKIGFCPDQ